MPSRITSHQDRDRGEKKDTALQICMIEKSLTMSTIIYHTPCQQARWQPPMA